MNRFFLLIPWIIMITGVQAQEPQKEKVPGKFHAGVDYSFIQTDMKLTWMTRQNTWNGTEYDLIELTDEEIDDMNRREEFTRKFQSISAEFGMFILNKPGGKWFIDGTLSAGIAKPYYRIYNTETDTMELLTESGFSMFTTGLKFNFRYCFTPHWGIGVLPYMGYSFGTNKKIDDNTYGHITYFSEDRSNRYTYLYSRINVYVSYTCKGFTVSAGPGFYLLTNSNNYKLERVDPASGDTYLIEVKSRLRSKEFIDGTLAIEWRIIEALSVTAFGALGHDIVAYGGIRYHF